jgi:hypothetical protein
MTSEDNGDAEEINVRNWAKKDIIGFLNAKMKKGS